MAIQHGKNLIDITTLIGAKGQDGADGKSAYELYLEAYPNYSKSEEEWLDDLINDRLGTSDQVIISFDSQGGTPLDPPNSIYQ